MLWEIDDELERRTKKDPTSWSSQVGVGAFAAAVARHFRRPGASPRPKLMSVEPASADCLLESVAAGRIVSVPGPHDSIMSGLNCGRISLVAWPTVSRSIDLLVAVDDEPAREAMRLAAESGIVSGETGAAGLGGLLEILRTGGGGSADAWHRQGDPCPALQLRGRHRPRRSAPQKDSRQGSILFFPTDGFGKTTLRRLRYAAPHWFSPLSSRPRSVAGGAGRG